MDMEGLEEAAKKPLLLVKEIKLDNNNINGSQGSSNPSSSTSTSGYDFSSDPSSSSVTHAVVFSLFVLCFGAFGGGNVVSIFHS